MIKIIAKKKGFCNEKQENATIYIEDFAEFAYMILAMTEITFNIGWLRVQLILFYQFAGITDNRPEALVELRFRYLKLTLIRNPNGNRLRLFIELTAEFIKGFFGLKDAYMPFLFACNDLSHSANRT